jgi:hypothetical protein
MLDCANLDLDPAEIKLIHDPELIRINRRALRQRGLFSVIKTPNRPVEKILEPGLSRIILPVTIREDALADLDEMIINATTLFAVLDAAASTAQWRLPV